MKIFDDWGGPVASIAAAGSTDAPRRLRVEYLDAAAIGIGERRPRLSWLLPDGSARQTAYRVEFDLGDPVRGDSDWVDSDRSVLLPWPGPDLGSRQRVAWRVKVRTDVGESDWSAAAWFETGMSDPDDWVARWIEPVEAARAPSGERPAHVLRRGFELASLPREARLYATAHGIYEVFINGHRCGDVELAPGFTDYRHTLNVQVYDVGPLVVAGKNVWEVVLSDGWYRGRLGFRQRADNYGDTVAFLGQLHLAQPDGTDVIVATGPEWRSGTGPIIAADLVAGQREDRLRVVDDWRPVALADHGLDRLACSPAPPVRRVQQLHPVAITRPLPDRQIVDLGQNITGWVRLHDLGPAGTTLTLTHGEMLDEIGDLTQVNLRLPGLSDGEPGPGLQIDQVVSAGVVGDFFEPRHTAHGFQYVRVEGYPRRLTPDDVTGVVVHSDLRRTGWFRCSDDRLDRLHAMAEWSFRDNACDIPTDCPQRERSGWTGDWQIFSPTAAFLYDVAGFSVKWLRDLATGQRPDGCVANIVPDPVGPIARDADADPVVTMFQNDLQGSAGWGDASVLVPWELWRAYDDTGILAELWPTMLRWIDFAATSARTGRHPDRIASRPEPAPHEAFLWDTGFHWGEWLEPGDDVTDPEGGGEFRTADHSAVATAYLYRSSQIAARIARLLGHVAESTRLGELAEAVLAAWRLEFIGPDGRLAPDTQATCVRALAFGLVPAELRQSTATRLVELIRRAGTHLGTGFLATPYLLPVLADSGHLDIAYELLFQDTQPSWLAMVDRGATTVWETWEGPDGAHPMSLNHYSKGAVVSFLHRYVAGIQLLDDHPGYRHFRVAPCPGGGLSWAEAGHDSPYGWIESSWRLDGDQIHLTVTVPPGTTAEILLPDGTRVASGPGRWMGSCPAVPRAASRPEESRSPGHEAT
ncbi:glycoside hydrolase family 78 protein [Frankia sp. Mgl5]|uniref:family 78 glycoside hydrolase catalytic domain n=1 Tax=Frankia sp. Mgl5 TaxID=2933793 RepID=UPI0020106E55|nr:family 78 glycoside hydrolase catalytic domain [Frankia sp. Mgl5]MCK9931694.1 glycoside hydrolase family 78 protein [Frankia sp. Mgl5]